MSAKNPGQRKSNKGKTRDDLLAELNAIREKEVELLGDISEMGLNYKEIKALHDEINSLRMELRNKDDELQVQKEELCAQAEELETQLDELRCANEELENNIKQRKKLEEAHSQLASIVEASSDAIISKTLDGVITSWNKGAEQIYGYMSDEVIGKSISILAPHDMPDEIPDILKRIRHGEAIVYHDTKRVRKDGKLIDVSLTISPIKDITNRIIGAATIARDVTERKRAEEALHESEAKYRIVADNTYDWEFWLDTDGKFLYTSPSCRQITGYSAEEFIEDPDLKLKIIYDEDLPAFKKHYSEEARHGKSGELEYRIITKDGKIKWVHHVCLPVLEKGRHIGTRGSNRDITERKQAEQKLAYVASFPERNTNPIIEIDDIGAIKYSNPAADRLFPELRSSGASHKMLGSITPDMIKQDLKIPIVRDVFVNGAYYQQTILYMPESRTFRIYAIDITERKKAEESLLEKTENIETMAEELEVQNEEIIANNKDIQEARMQAELYLDLMGHDISNMHQIAMGQLELAQDIITEDGKLESNEKELIDTSIDVLKRSAQLVENVRKLQKIRAGEYKIESIDVCKLLTEVVEENSLGAGNINMSCYTDGGSFVRANPLLKDVFINIIGNAIKHSKGKASISVDINKVNENGKTLCRVSVEDNGPGIPDEMKEKIFHRFEQGQTSVRGTGLGLYIVKTLLDSFDGQVKVEDRVLDDYSKGSRFIVFLPITEDAHVGK